MNLHVHSPPDPAIPPKISKCTSPNGIHGPKQGDPREKSRNTHTYTPDLTKQAPPSPHIHSDPESSPKTQKYTIPNRSYDPNQENPRQKFQPTPTPSSGHIKQGFTSPNFSSDPEMPPKTLKQKISNRSHGPKQGDPWEKSWNTFTSPLTLTNQSPPSLP